MFSGGHVLLDFSAIPKLYGPENFWHWRMLLRAYLESADLWKDDHPKESSHAKFILLATVQADKIEPGYDDETPKQIFKSLEERFRPY
ncbi:uncharacterized protein LOC111603643 [Drosophila hydei]|uniref:Uncharacterized protein LOC111603643 n=1 Tax=Drosophila hydei TaxID=7224 RepID=A0A6J1M7B7_DROHY|nr:uncharacterized protein LOC111603643 [Drosophila hydei]